MAWSLKVVFDLLKLNSVKHEEFEIKRLKISIVLIGPLITEILE